METLKDRIKAVRKSLGMSQTEFGKALGASLSAASKWESGENSMGESTILLLCQRYGVNEIWLRTGAGEMFSAKTREEEMTEAVARLMSTAPDSFKASLVAVMLRFDPDGPEWEVVERIYRSVAAEIEKGPGQ